MYVKEKRSYKVRRAGKTQGFVVMLWVKRDRDLYAGDRDVQGTNTEDWLDGKEIDMEGGEEGDSWNTTTFWKNQTYCSIWV